MDRTITDTSYFGLITFLVSRLARKTSSILGKMDGQQAATVHNTNDLIVHWSKLYPNDYRL